MTKVTDYYDMATFLRQLGATFEPPRLQSHGPRRLPRNFSWEPARIGEKRRGPELLRCKRPPFPR
jgi:hypothetical protein